MHLNIKLFLCMLTSLTVNAQTINLGGIVSNKTGQPVASAIVTLVRQSMKDTTGVDGKYSLAQTVAVTLPAIVPLVEEVTISNSVLQFNLSNPSPVKIEIYDIKGTVLKKEILTKAPAGVYRFAIAKNCRATNLLVIKAAIGKREVSFSYMPLSGGRYLLNPSTANATPIDGGLTQMAAILDTLKVTATGYQSKTITITSYNNQQQNITLDSASASADTGRSIGCGKPLSAIKSGTYTITSSGLSRQYIINIPADYDMNHPYRLIFGMHCYGSSAQGVVNEKFYSLKPLADNAKVACIWVAPNGTGSSTPMWDKGQQDHTFFDDMLKLFKENLCIDTARVFSCGFSYGAMFTYSLSLSHQKQLRAVACYAPANWNIWLPTNTHEPIAFYSTTGTDDPNCKYIYDDAKKEGGKYCVLQHIEDNGCPVPSSIPTATSGKHVTTEFPGCKAGYPVVFGSFQGQHACVVSDQGSNVNWIAAETWKFFMRF